MDYELRYEDTGETRAPREGEWFRGCRGTPERARIDFSIQKFPILREVKSPTSIGRAKALDAAILAERETCLDIIRGYAQDCGCSSVIEAAILADVEGHGLTREEERAARGGHDA